MFKYSSRILLILAVLFSNVCFAEMLSNNDINLYLKTFPVASNTLDKVTAKIGKDKKLNIELAMGQMEGNMHRKMMGMIKGWPEHALLKEIVKKQGFKSIDDWALVADRISGVIMSTSMVMMTASMGEKPLREDMNLFAYLDDKKNDAGLRKKYKDQLAEMCDRLCYKKTDLESVKNNYAKITNVLNKK